MSDGGPSQPLQLSLVALPQELQSRLDQAYLLHTLVLRSSIVLPPGKSVLSLYTQSRRYAREEGSVSTDTPIETRIRKQLEQAFWDDALEKLSSPRASDQLARLQVFYMDLHEALSSILSKDDPLMVGLAEPMSPTSAPLESALVHVIPILSKLLTLCAPARDISIRSLLEIIKPLPSAHSPLLPKLCVDTFKGLLELAKQMKEDLNDVAVALMGETEFSDFLKQQAAEAEREAVEMLYEPADVSAAWVEWLHVSDLSDAEHKTLPWIKRLMLALASSLPIQPTIPPNFSENAGNTTDGPSTSPSPHNRLPPPLLLESPHLFGLQNMLQAVVITACLTILVPSPATSSRSPSQNNFASRVWAILSSEVGLGSLRPPSSEPVKLIHLEEEVISAWKASRLKRKADDPLDAEAVAKSNKLVDGPTHAGMNSSETENERSLRKSVDRMLRTEDPVFALLRKRVMDALEKYLIQDPIARTEGIPETMRTGRRLPSINVGHSTEDVEPQRPKWDGKVKGFEYEVLENAIITVAEELWDIARWMEYAWPFVRAP